jgi:hypothetical protein
MTATVAMPRDFHILTPDGWIGVDLDPATMFERVERLVDERLRLVPVAEPHRRDLLAAVGRGVARAAAAGAFRAWFYSDVLEGRAVSASLTATVVTTNLPSGRVERRARRVATPAPTGGGSPVDSISVQYFLPVPGSRSVLMLSFATPNVGLEDAFLTLFDSMVATLRWTS